MRSPVPEDYDAIKAFFDGLAPESRYLRFHGLGRTDLVSRDYAEADGDNRVALLARRGERVVAVAGYERLREPDVAEVAFAVADELQGHGLGTRMLEQLAAYAAEQSIHRFVADVLSDNRQMLGVFASAGFGTDRESGFGEVQLSLDITPSARLVERILERDRVSAVASLRPVLAPSSIAVVGAFGDADVGGELLSNIVHRGYQGVATPVCRSRPVVCSMRAAASLAELDELPELVVVAVGAEEVLAVVEEAARLGVRALLVLSAGFSDSDDPAGAEREERLLEVVRSYGARLIGPNSMGVLNTAADKQLRAIVGNVAVEPGGLALSSQSGALGIALLGQAAARQLGISGFVSLGNRADVSTNDLLEYWAQDERTATIALYVETFGNPRRSLMIARRVSRTKPILVMTGGRALERGAASSHTAAALREEAVVDAMFRAAGVLRPASTEALFDVAAVLERQPLPRGRRVAVITNSGGLGRLATDACERHGLTVVRPDDSTLDLLRRYFPAADRIDNPLDMGIHARAADYRTAVTALCGDPAVDAVLVLCAAIAGSDPHAVLDAVEAAAGGRTCIVASVIGADGRLPERREWRVPNVAFAETAASAVAMAADRREWLSRRLGQVPRLPGFDAERVEALVASRATPGEARWLAADDTEQILAAAGIPYVPARLCPDVDAALTAALDIDGPTALKAHFPPPAHAADIDAVLIGVQGERGVRAGWRELERRVRDAGRDWHGALVQPLAGAGADVLVGVVAEADLGPLIGLGMGGRYAALSGDVAFRVAPLTDVDADELIAASRAVRAWLAGFRGAPPLDGAALRDLLVRFSKLVEHAPDLVEADLNPVRLTTAGCAVLDARIRLERRLPRSSVRTW